MEEVVNNMIAEQQRRKVRAHREARIPFRMRYRNGATALRMIRTHIRESQESPCVTDLASYFIVEEKEKSRKKNYEESTVTKPSKKIAWLIRWRGPQVFYNTKVLFLRFFESLSACPSFNVTLVSLLDAGPPSDLTQRNSNPWAAWIPKKKKIPRHMRVDHAVFHETDIHSLIGTKSRDLFSKKGSEVFRDVFVVKWWIGLPRAESDTFDSVWVSDDDVFYNGNLCDFLTKYHASREWDLLTSSPTTAAEWPHRGVTTYPFPSDVFFRAMDHVIGMSGRLLGMIRMAIGVDILLHSEAFAVTLCKANAPLCQMERMRETIGKQYAWNNQIEYEYYKKLIQSDDNMWYHGFRANNLKEMNEIFEDDLRFNALDLMRMKEDLADVSPEEKEYLNVISRGYKLEFRCVCRDLNNFPLFHQLRLMNVCGQMYYVRCRAHTHTHTHTYPRTLHTHRTHLLRGQVLGVDI